MALTVTDISNEIYEELGKPSTISVPAVSFWVRSNLGKLNAYIGTSYEVSNPTLEITPQIGEQEKAILKKMYELSYYDSKIRENLGSAASNSVVEISSDGARIRKISSNDIAKSFSRLKFSESESLTALINAYLNNGLTPFQIREDSNCGSD